MSLFTISPDELPPILSQLDQAIYSHQQWYDALSRTLICRLPANPHDLREDAHRECVFGQWYYHNAPQKIREHPGFIALGTEHEHMHQQAARLLHMASRGTAISATDYDNFATLLEHVRLEILTLTRELEDLLHSTDPLTGASNRISMLPRLREQQELVKRGVQRCCIAMMDLDRFKAINDTRGHIAGDQVLAAAARYVIDHLRPYDRVFRFGGEEFLIYMVHTDLKQAHELVERLRQGLADLAIDIGNGEPLHITASFGLSQLESGVSVEQSIDRADKAMYTAKSTGRNRVRVWEPSMDA